MGILLPSIGYPILIGIFSNLKQFFAAKGVNSEIKSDSALPFVSYILCAYNEEAVLREKLENTLSLQYPSEKLDVLVLSDASSDQTDQIAREFSDRGIRLLRSEARIGKSANLSRFVPSATGSILVFTDANSIYQKDALQRLVAHFTDPKVGYVVGAQRYTSHNANSDHGSENKYWELELKIKEWESNISSVVGADGAIFAMRKELFEPLQPSDISDFLGPLKIVNQGYQGVFDPKAVCYEPPVSSMQRNFYRKVRIVTRSYQAVAKVPNVLLPWKTGWFAIQVWFHKVLRWLSPFFLIITVVGAAIDAMQGRLGGMIILGMFAAWILTASLYLVPQLRRISIVSTACYALVVSAAALVALVLVLTGRNINTWKPDR
jgi:cellulose synthase/poly-beta-1,6-N-acetylglucosamine synthase-like glycosyltransferase